MTESTTTTSTRTDSATTETAMTESTSTEPATWRAAFRSTVRAIRNSPGVALFARAIWTSLIAVTLVSSFATMVELDRLIAQAISSEGKSWTLSSIIGFQPWLALEAWPGWRDTSFGEIDVIIRLHAFADTVFIAAYGAAGLLLIRTFVPRAKKPAPKNPLPKNPPATQPRAKKLTAAETKAETKAEAEQWKADLRRKQLSLYRLLAAVVAFDLLENLTIWFLAGVPIAALIWLQIALTLLKWAAFAALVLRTVFGDTVGASLRAWIQKMWAGVYGQRLGVILVAAVAAMTIFTGSGVQDQLPDVYRGWIQYPDGAGGVFTIDLAQAGWAALVAFFVGIGLFYFGRQRGYQYYVGKPVHPANLPAWAYVALGITLFALILTSMIDAVSFDSTTFAVFVGVLVAIPASSAIIRRIVRPRPKGEPGPHLLEPFIDADPRTRAGAVFGAGDFVVGAWIAVVMLGPFVALITPLALNIIGAFTATKFSQSTVQLAGWAVLLWVLAWVLPAVTWALVRRYFPVPSELMLTETSDMPPAETTAQTDTETPEEAKKILAHQADGYTPKERAHDSFIFVKRLFSSAFVVNEETPTSTSGAQIFGAIIAAVSVAIIVTFALFPFSVAKIGTVAAMQALLGAWAGLIGWLILRLGLYKPPEVFQALRLRSTPVITLAIVVPLVIASGVDSPVPHAVAFAQVDSETVMTRPSLADAFTTWAADACESTIEVEIDGTDTAVPVKVLTLVAAQGGGIRAATWTVDVLRELPRASECAANSVMLSAGASGGSVGLAYIARAAGENPLKVTIGSISGPDPLATDAIGLLSSDLVAGMTGVMIPSNDLAPGVNFAWRDRAALHAEVYQAAASAPEQGLGKTFDADFTTPTGYMIFNATDAATNCKVIISQVDIAERSAHRDQVSEMQEGGDATRACTGLGAELSNTIDLFDHLGEECTANVTWATASLLSARFPFVSPSARVQGSTVPKGCTPLGEMQLLDGGLIDNSALGTVSDVFSELAVLVREANSDPDRTAIIVPVVLFASNEPGADVVRDTSNTRPEILAPVAAIGGAEAVHSSPSAWLTRLSNVLDDVCAGEAESNCATVVEAVRDDLPGSLVVVSPSTKPSITVPLGWTLSSFSRSRLRVESDLQRLCGRDESHVDHEYDFTKNAVALKAGDDACKSSGDYGRFGVFLNLFDEAQPSPTP